MRRSNDISGILGFFIIVALLLVALAGWVMNIIEIYNHVNEPVTGMFVLRLIGVVFAPLGMVLGWL